MITLQYWGGFGHILTWISHRYTGPAILNPPLSSPPIRLGCPRALALSALLMHQTCTGHWSSILHMVIYIFQCCSLIPSHPCLLSYSPKVSSLHLCLFCCLAYRIIVTIFLISIYISPPRLSAARRELGSRCPWLGEAAPQPECCSVCAQKAPARPGLPWSCPPA